MNIFLQFDCVILV